MPFIDNTLCHVQKRDQYTQKVRSIRFQTEFFTSSVTEYFHQTLYSTVQTNVLCTKCFLKAV